MKKANATIAIPPEGDYNYFTAGKEYPIIEWREKYSVFSVIADNGNTLQYCLPKGCAHINCKNWKFK